MAQMQYTEQQKAKEIQEEKKVQDFEKVKSWVSFFYTKVAENVCTFPCFSQAEITQAELWFLVQTYLYAEVSSIEFRET